MLVTLSIVFCLAGNPTKCEQVFPEADDASMGLASCAIRGQQLAQIWLDDHPRYILNRIRCTPGNEPRNDDI